MIPPEFLDDLCIVCIRPVIIISEIYSSYGNSILPTAGLEHDDLQYQRGTTALIVHTLESCQNVKITNATSVYFKLLFQDNYVGSEITYLYRDCSSFKRKDI